MLMEFVLKIKATMVMPSYTGGEHKENITAQLLNDIGMPHVQKVADYRKKNGNKWLCGENLMWIDFYFFECLDYCVYLTNGEIFKQLPEMEAYHK